MGKTAKTLRLVAAAAAMLLAGGVAQADTVPKSADRSNSL